MDLHRYPLLTRPIQIGRVVFRNRMFSAPMGATDITADCCPGPRVQGFYELRAKGGAAAVTVSELVVHPETDGSHMLHLDLETPGCLAAHTFVADGIRRHGAVPSIELSHSGQYAGTYMADKNRQAALCQGGPCDGVRPDGRSRPCRRSSSPTSCAPTARKRASRNGPATRWSWSTPATAGC